ncbi:MAG: DUF3551 domain-containing protein [Bradyrhizobium sp.]|nr:DUF3551 domain-containing protein [Bradyrhizobium sp.]
MRILSWMILLIGTILASAPVTAQTYDPNFPVCLQVYAPRGGYIECAYTSLAQCALSASGRAAQCLVNPFWTQAYPQTPGRTYRRRHRVY